VELQVGDLAPDFSLQDQHENQVSLKDFKGKKIVLYFYPKDMTPGCTVESCDFQESLVRFEEKDVVILGISKDSISSHKKFAEKYNLKFSLLSDADGEICSKYGVIKKNKVLAKVFGGITRTTFIVDKDLHIQKIYPQVKVSGHVTTVLKDCN
jgi:thioredoxin-dependent peroxiredoxin